MPRRVRKRSPMAINGVEPMTSQEFVEWFLAYERKRLKELEAYVSQRASKSRKGKQDPRSMRAIIRSRNIQSLGDARRKAPELLKKHDRQIVSQEISRYKRELKEQK